MNHDVNTTRCAFLTAADAGTSARPQWLGASPSINKQRLADNSGRHKPGTGEINYPFLFEHLDRIGYTGWIGCEYAPKSTTIEGLGWVESYLETRT